MPLVSITRLRVRSWRHLAIFFVQALRSARLAARSDGNLATMLLRDANRTFWTATSWTDERTMKAFMHAPPHGPGMRKLLEWCDEASLVHWTQESGALPSWSDAHARLQRDGRTSKVLHPSPAHEAFQIAPPTGTSALTLRAHTPPSSSS
jgi:heme-degrading monooxygenase HmoA